MWEQRWKSWNNNPYIIPADSLPCSNNINNVVFIFLYINFYRFMMKTTNIFSKPFPFPDEMTAPKLITVNAILQIRMPPQVFFQKITNIKTIFSLYYFHLILLISYFTPPISILGWCSL